ncbi:cysteine desulfurase mitochondrial-like [Senna tora]|uniref:Cysteine desulfurase mitochondrial-like n=1 Tax=Senna tora TaxID=362788 RepID=A0A834WM71_9FABA|nr:cysteine desulfurase mitochondrial-like [Senna tora]
MALSNIWGNPSGFKVVEIEKYTFQFYFDRDLESVLKGGPWLYRNCWLMLHRWRRDWQSNRLDFDQDAVWIQFGESHCEFVVQGQGESNTGNNKFGPWIRANNFGKRVDFVQGQQSSQREKTQIKVSGLGVNKINSYVLLDKLNSLTVKESIPSSPSKDKAISESITMSEGNMMEVSSPHISTRKRLIRAEKEKGKEQTSTSNKRQRDEELDKDNNSEAINLEGVLKKVKILGIHQFRFAVDDYNLVDLGFEGNIFTWCNKCDPPHTVYAGAPSGNPHTFRFEKIWMNHADCANIVRDTWRDGLIGGDPAQKLNFKAERFKAWNKNTFGHVGKKIRDLQQRISSLFNSSVVDDMN